MTEEGPLIVRDSTTVLIPEIARQTILDKLHSTHLSVEYMKAMARNRFFWPGLQEDLHNTFQKCGACKRESASKPNTRRYNTGRPVTDGTCGGDIYGLHELWLTVHPCHQEQVYRVHRCKAVP